MKNEIPFDVVTDVSPHVARVRNLTKAIWRRIPSEDKLLMLKQIASYPKRRLRVVIKCDWDRSMRTNGMIHPDDGVILIDGGYVNAADGEHVSSTLAHEFGHLRGHADPNGRDRSEETANRFQQALWGYPEGEVFYKCNVSRQMEEILHLEGISGQILWDPSWRLFIWVLPDERLKLHSANYVSLEQHPSDAIERLLLGTEEHPYLNERRKNARNFKRRVRFKQIKATMDVMHELYMGDEE